METAEKFHSSTTNGFGESEPNVELDGELNSIENDIIENRTFKNRILRSFKLSIYAQDMPMYRAILLVILGIFFTWTTSLLVTGFQGLYPVLIEEGVYSHLCPVNSTSLNGPGDINDIPVCNKQKLRLNLMLTITVSLLNVNCFPVGFLIDKFGPTWVGLAGSISTALGSVLFAFSSRSFDAYIPGYILIGMGGSTIFMTLLHTANIFPSHRGIVVSLLTAAEDSSTGIFYFFRIFHKLGISLRSLFLGYTSIPLLHFFVVYLQPKRAILAEKYENQIGKEFYPISNLPLSRQIKSLTFWAIVLWNCITCVTSYFYISTLNNQILWLFGSAELAKKASDIFSLLFIIFPFAAVPVTGWLLNRFGTWPSLILVAFQFLFYGVISVIPVWKLQFFAFGMFVICRASYIATSAHLVNLMFGENFSTLIGIVWTMGGLSALTNHLWVYITLDILHGNFFIMNVILMFLAVAGSLLLAFIVYKELPKEKVDHIPLENMIPINKEEPTHI